MDAKQALLDYKKKLDPEIKEFFKTYIKEHKDLTPDAKMAIEIICDAAARGGKRLRAAFLYYSYILLGGTEREKVFQASILIEIIHAYILMEDDFMDRDEKRRGGKTAHVVYKEYYEKNFKEKDAGHSGASLALTAAICASHISQQYLAEIDFPSDRVLRMIRKINNQVVYTGFGQIHDLLSEVREDFDESDAMQVHHWKTAVYTYEMPIHAGAILAGANDSDLELLSEYSIPAGIAFQIQDDILGIYASEEKLGKPVGSDIKEGKQTILVLKVMENGTPEEKKQLTSILGKPKITQKELDSVRTIMKDTGAYDYAKNLAQKYVEDSLKALKKMDKWNNEGLDFLEGIAQYMIERDL